MIRYLLSKIIQIIVVLLCLSFLSFVFIKLAPGDPVKAMLDIDEVLITEAEIEDIRSEMGFDQPIFVQYGMWLKQAIKLDFGESYLTNRPVLSEIQDRLQASLELMGGGMLVVILISIPLGVCSAVYQSKWIDHLGRIFAFFGASIPSFWLGLLLIYFFSVKLKVLPFIGNNGAESLILPSLTLGLAMSAVYARLLRAAMLETMNKPYIKALRMKGIREKSLIFKYSLRESMIPVVTMFGMSLGNLLAGAIVVEILFSWPGLGKMVVEAIMNRDYPLIQAYILLSGIFVMSINLIVDLSYYLLDPKLRRKEQRT